MFLIYKSYFPLRNYVQLIEYYKRPNFNHLFLA
jgi:hypothetical protein